MEPSFSRKVYAFTLVFSLVAMFSAYACLGPNRPAPTATQAPADFNGERAYEAVERQVSLGPRIPGSPAHAEAVDWMVQTLDEAGWETEIHETIALGNPVRNVVARLGQGEPWIILGAHYDSRLRADEDPDPSKHSQPVPGANDGASGVAVLLELARVLPGHFGAGKLRPGQITLVFFDAEDNGRIENWDWILGSRAFVRERILPGEALPDAMVLVDMIGDADLNIYRERNSDPELTDEIWSAAAELGYDESFIDQPKYNILDDHLPFLEAGIPAVDLIDFDYPYWHTTSDTADKVSPDSLQAVGDTLLAWLSE